MIDAHEENIVANHGRKGSLVSPVERKGKRERGSDVLLQWG